MAFEECEAVAALSQGTAKLLCSSHREEVTPVICILGQLEQHTSGLEPAGRKLQWVVTSWNEQAIDHAEPAGVTAGHVT